MSWSDEFATFTDACIAYGVDTPAQLEAEAEYEAELWAIERAALEAEYGPYVLPAVVYATGDDIPF